MGLGLHLAHKAVPACVVWNAVQFAAGAVLNSLAVGRITNNEKVLGIVVSPATNRAICVRSVSPENPGEMLLPKAVHDTEGEHSPSGIICAHYGLSGVRSPGGRSANQESVA